MTDCETKNVRGDGVKGVCVGELGGGNIGVIDMTSEGEECFVKNIGNDTHSTSSNNSRSNNNDSSNNNDGNYYKDNNNSNVSDIDMKIKNKTINANRNSNSNNNSDNNNLTVNKDESSHTSNNRTIWNLGNKIPAKRNLDLSLESEQLDRKRARSLAFSQSSELR